jgi:hypothetical protein
MSVQDTLSSVRNLVLPRQIPHPPMENKIPEASNTKIHHKKSIRLADRCNQIFNSLCPNSQKIEVESCVQRIRGFLGRFVIDENEISGYIDLIRSLREDMQNFVNLNSLVLSLAQLIPSESQYSEDTNDIENDFESLKVKITEMSLRAPRELSVLLRYSSDDFHLQVSVVYHFTCTASLLTIFSRVLNGEKQTKGSKRSNFE